MASGPGADETRVEGAPNPSRGHNIHEEPDGTVIETLVVGTRRTVAFASGRVHMSETYTMDQTATRAGDLVYDSSALTTSRVIYIGEFTILFSLKSHAEMLWGDGRDCAIDTRFLVVRNAVKVNEQVGPICSMT
jgi:hypothetical protein